MAPSAVPFEPSYAALTNLRHKIHKHTTSVNLTLPTRPSDLSTDSNPYLDGAIGILSDSTALLYDDDAPWAVKVIEVKKAVDRVDTKVDEVKTEVAEIKTEVAGIKTEVAEIKTEMKLLENRLESQIDDVRTAVNNGRAIQLNSLRKWLDDPIQPISAFVQIEDRQRYMVAADFPTTVREFWRLLPNKSALIRLANHYSVAGWDRWKRATSGDTDVTCYMELEDAVTAHPDKCLRALAMSWGLQQTALEQLGEPSRQEGRRRRPFRQEGRLGKRKADTDNGSRRVRAREGRDNDSVTESESTSSQDVNDDDKQSQQSQVISVQL